MGPPTVLIMYYHYSDQPQVQLQRASNSTIPLTVNHVSIIILRKHKRRTPAIHLISYILYLTSYALTSYALTYRLPPCRTEVPFPFPSY